MGERGKAMATWVSSVTRLVDVAATASGRNESWAVSLVDTPSYPMDSAHAASAATPSKSRDLSE